jgi:uncharacterized repeat protein (TIGR01451 family)
MKKLPLLFICLLFFGNLKAQFVIIPDAKFVTWLQANVPTAMVGNQMDTTNTAVTLRIAINVENDSIGDLTGVQYFDSLKTLDFGNDQYSIAPKNFVTNLPRLPVALDSLICGNNNLTSLPILPNSITVLKCYQNPLYSLPALPTSLQYLDCTYDSLLSLPVLPNTLTNLQCDNNNLSNLPVLPSLLQVLTCESNLLTNLPALPSSVEYLYCDGNLITNLPTLPPFLIEFGCSGNQLSSLPSLPSSISRLQCGGNTTLTSLPTLPISLTYLLCEGCSLTNLPALPNSLISIACDNNQLTNLPTLPNSLLYLYCHNNNLANLPMFPSTLGMLECHDNQISCFPVFPSSLGQCAIYPNPFNCLPNYVPSMDATTLAYPLCGFGNTNGCPNFEGVIGYTFQDKNSDCIKNTGDSSLKNVSIKIYHNSPTFVNQTITALNGVYGFPQTLSTYTVVVDTAGMPFTSQCANHGLDSMIIVNTIDTNINFSLTCKPGFDIGVQSVIASGFVFPGQQYSLNFVAGDISHWYNLNCASGISGQVQIWVTGNVTYVGPALGALTPSVAGNLYTYTIADFGLVNNTTDFNLIFNTNTNAQAGDTICVNIAVTPTAGDNNVSNNNFAFCYLVWNSHDPNRKEVYPVDVAPLYNDWFTYSIHFQNTGTAAAMNIRLADTLDNNLDLSTFQVINYSHNNTSLLNGNLLTFNFPSINLPDSGSNFNGSQGYVQYRIKPKPNLPAGTQIKNTADIYFDFNPAVVTNTTINHFLNPVGIKEINAHEFSVYPNPSENEFTVRFTKNSSAKISVYSVEGNLLLEKVSQSNIETLSLKDFAKGIYILKVESEQKVFTKKLIKN